jgi:hypothetical protein
VSAIAQSVAAPPARLPIASQRAGALLVRVPFVMRLHLLISFHSLSPRSVAVLYSADYGFSDRLSQTLARGITKASEGAVPSRGALGAGSHVPARAHVSYA